MHRRNVRHSLDLIQMMKVPDKNVSETSIIQEVVWNQTLLENASSVSISLMALILEWSRITKDKEAHLLD